MAVATLKVREIREAKGISQTFVAREMGFKHPSTLQKIESGKRKLEMHEGKKIAEILGVTMDDLFNFNLAEITNSNKANEGGTNCESNYR